MKYYGYMLRVIILMLSIVLVACESNNTGFGPPDRVDSTDNTEQPDNTEPPDDVDPSDPIEPPGDTEAPNDDVPPVEPISLTIVTHPQANTISVGESVHFDVQATGGNLTYQWRKNYQPIPGETASVLSLQSVTMEDAGLYDVVVTGSGTSVISTGALLTVNEKVDVGNGVGPTLLFSDLTSAQNNGWSNDQPEKGAVVTVWGYGFGEDRSGNYILVNDVAVTDPIDYCNWGQYWPTPFLQRISFRLNSAIPTGNGSIKVSINGAESNALDFTVRDTGRILFVDRKDVDGDGSYSSPYSDLQAPSFIQSALPGDTFYYREGVYDRRTNGGNSVLWIRSSEPSGTASEPIGILAYPGEAPEFFIESYNVNFRNGMQIANDYTTVSGLTFNSEYMAASMEGNYGRFVGNDASGLKDFYGAGTGIVITKNNGNQLLGNAIHGGRSANRFDHATYFSGCATEEGSHLGWNYIYDNDFGRGPELAINHQGNRCLPDIEIMASHYIYNNVVDCGPQRAVAINIYDLSYDEGEAEPKPTFIYNNIFTNCGTLDTNNTQHIGWAPAFVINSGHSRVYNNVLYNASYLGFSISHRILSTEIKNNIVVMNSDVALSDNRSHKYVDISTTSPLYVDKLGDVITLTDNLFYDRGSMSTVAGDLDEQNNIVGLDPLFFNPEHLDFRLKIGSPAIGQGDNNLIFDAPQPANAPINRDMMHVLRTVFDMGALQHQ